MKCPDCGRHVSDHSLTDIIECVYAGMEAEGGRPFDRKDAETVVKRVAERLKK